MIRKVSTAANRLCHPGPRRSMPSSLLQLLHLLRPLFRIPNPLMPPSKQLPFPLVQTPQELRPLTTASSIIGFARMQAQLPGPYDKGPPKHGAQLPLVEQIQHTDTNTVQVGTLVAQRHGSGVGFERVDDLFGQTRR